MPLSSALLILAAVIGVTTLVGVLLRVRAARANRPRHADSVDAVVSAGALGTDATLVLFHTELCAQCPAVRRVLTDLASERPGVAHTEVDLTHDTETAARLRIMQTPTVFILGRDGRLVTRFAGATPRTAFEAEIDRILEVEHV